MSAIIKFFISLFVLFWVGAGTLFVHPPTLNFVTEAISPLIQTSNNNITVTQLEPLLENPDEVLIIDVRTTSEYQTEHLPNAISIPVSEIEQRIDEIKQLSKNKHVITYCAIGPRSYKALSIMKQHQIEGSNLEGGFQAWWKNKKHINQVKTNN